jgi:RNA-binding protein
MNNAQKKALKAHAHHVKGFISLGNSGITPNFIKEVIQTINAHELIKIKIMGETKAIKQQLAQEISSLTESEFIQIIGNQATFFKLNPEKNKYNI